MDQQQNQIPTANEEPLAWTRWANRVNAAARAIGVWSPTLSKNLDPVRKGNAPKASVLAAGRWLLVEHLRRTKYELTPKDVPMFARI